MTPGTASAGMVAALAANLSARWTIRHRVDADMAFLSTLYASTREDEMRIVPWPPEVKQAFLQDQFNKQHTHYLSGYPDALWLILEQAGEPAGRIYVEQTNSEIRLMEISLLPAHRNAGLGTSLMSALLDFADLQGLPVTLHVEPYNPAKRLYQRCGFLDVETHGYYVLMQRMPHGKAS